LKKHSFPRSYSLEKKRPSRNAFFSYPDTKGRNCLRRRGGKRVPVYLLHRCLRRVDIIQVGGGGIYSKATISYGEGLMLWGKEVSKKIDKREDLQLLFEKRTPYQSSKKVGPFHREGKSLIFEKVFRAEKGKGTARERKGEARQPALAGSCRRVEEGREKKERRTFLEKSPQVQGSKGGAWGKTQVWEKKTSS